VIVNKRFLFVFLLLSLFLESSFALDFWQYPEAANENSIFINAFAASLEFSSPGIDGLDFSFLSPEFSLDYLLPIGLPFSFGLFILPLGEDFFGFGIRPGYHINLDVDLLDLYAVYPVSFVIHEKALSFHYGLGAGLRVRIKNFFFFNMEISPSLTKGLRLGVSLKLN